MTDTQDVIAIHTITQRDAAHVLGALGLPGGLQPGGFQEKLIEAMLVADTGNQKRLARGFEGLMAAVQTYRLSGGTKILQRIADGKP